MASTNKTTHYNLSQYVGTDKPTYLVDYNTDMSNIDTGIYNAQGKADNNETNIGTLSSLTTTDKTNLVNAINEVDSEATANTSHIGNLSNLTTEANTSLVSAINEVDLEADTNNQNIGTMINLETTVKSSLVGAINEVNTNTTTNSSHIGTLSSLTTTDKTSLVGAINEVNSKEWTLIDTKTGTSYIEIPSGVNEIMVVTKLSSASQKFVNTILASELEDAYYYPYGWYSSGTNYGGCIWYYSSTNGIKCIALSYHGTDSVSSSQTTVYYK